MSDTVLIIGCGLIGGSLAAALSQSGYSGKVLGLSRRVETLQAAKASDWFAAVGSEPDQLVPEADILVLCTPLGVFADQLQAVKPYLKPEAVITDVGSVKLPVEQLMRTHLPEYLSQVIPGHPIAGSEQSGVQAARADLFVSHRVILTPLPETDPRVQAKVSALWKLVGAEVVSLSATLHDEVLAVSSHLPHALAFAFVNSMLGTDVDQAHAQRVLQNAAGGLKDFTRIAGSDPVMWRDILLANQAAVLPLLQQLQTDLARFTQILSTSDSDALLSILTSAQAAQARIATELMNRGDQHEPH